MALGGICRANSGQGIERRTACPRGTRQRLGDPAKGRSRAAAPSPVFVNKPSGGSAPGSSRLRGCPGHGVSPRPNTSQRPDPNPVDAGLRPRVPRPSPRPDRVPLTRRGVLPHLLQLHEPSGAARGSRGSAGLRLARAARAAARARQGKRTRQRRDDSPCEPGSRAEQSCQPADPARRDVTDPAPRQVRACAGAGDPPRGRGETPLPGSLSG